MLVFALVCVVLLVLWVDDRAHRSMSHGLQYLESENKRLVARIEALEASAPKPRSYAWDKFGDKYDAETGEGPLPDPERDKLFAELREKWAAEDFLNAAYANDPEAYARIMSEPWPRQRDVIDRSPSSEGSGHL